MVPYHPRLGFGAGFVVFTEAWATVGCTDVVAPAAGTAPNARQAAQTVSHFVNFFIFFFLLI